MNISRDSSKIMKYRVGSNELSITNICFVTEDIYANNSTIPQ